MSIVPSSIGNGERSDQGAPRESSPLISKEEPLTTRLWKIVVAGTGFLCDAYDLFVINLVLIIMAIVYPDSKGDWAESSISTAALWGAVAGQLVFGFLADRIGRRKGFIATLSLVVFGAMGSAMSVDVADGIFVMLSVWRFVLGFGIGGEYPLSATISSESSTTEHRRGQQVAAVFSMQGVGILLAGLVVLGLLGIFGEDNLDLVWRLALALGGVPGLIMFYSRVKMKETEHFEKAKHTRAPIDYKLLFKTYWKTLLGTAGTWFIFDITFYANGLFNATILEVTGLGKQEGDTDYDNLMNTTKLSIYLALMGLPGYYAGVFLIDKLGRRKLQLIGFVCLGAVYILMAAVFDPLVDAKWPFIVLYGLTFFFSNAGPNTVTFVLPSEVFPTQVRATCHGISAAAGKVGAALGGATIKPLFNEYGLPTALYVCGVISFIGFVATFFFVAETKGTALNELPGAQNNSDTAKLIPKDQQSNDS